MHFEVKGLVQVYAEKLVGGSWLDGVVGEVERGTWDWPLFAGVSGVWFMFA